MHRFAAVVLVTSMACTHAQAPKARMVGEILSLAGVAGLVLSGAVAKTTTYDSTWFSAASAVISIAGIATFAAGDLTGGPPDPPPGPGEATKRRWAQTWTERAQGAARDGDCERVQAIEPRVRRLDPEIHDFIFMKDPEIAKCYPE
jgi:hypothetical protein